MALLSRCLFFCALAALVGCMVLGRGEHGLAFSHRLHVVEEGLECQNCHEDLAFAADPGMPSVDTCLLCHEEIDEEKAPERRVETLFDEAGEFRARRVSALGDEVVFDHLRHVAAEVECGACHAGIEDNERLGAGVAVAMDDCRACHAEREQPNECATCHSVIASDWQPESHHHNWKKLHGKVVRSRLAGPTNSCALCHEPSRCVDCHLDEPPDSHNNAWRLRTHAIAARMDRQTCAACHEPASCDRCHAEVLPRSHTGLWGGSKNVHCLTCHFPLKANGCVACHKGTPSHFLAPPKPAWHDPGMNCTHCHGVSVALLHVDKGDNCNICHL